MDRKPQTDREAEVEAVAATIRENYRFGVWGMNPAPGLAQWAREQNAKGWTIEITYPSQQPTQNSYSRVTIQLDDEQIAAAIRIAQQ